MIMLEPISEICLRMLLFDPCPMASMAMTEATPMMIPSAVRKERSLLAAIALNAILKRFIVFINNQFLLVVLWYRKLGECFGGRKDVRIQGVFLDLSVAQYDVSAAVLGYFRIMRYKYNGSAFGVELLEKH